MTDLLTKAFSEVSKLPPQKQDAVASWILSELSSEKQWEEKFAKSTEILEKLAAEAIKEHREGKTKPLDPEKI